jgi:hypothetical protein
MELEKTTEELKKENVELRKVRDFLKSYIKAGQPNLNKRDDRGE